MMLLCCRFGSRELIGGVAVQLEHADLFGLSVHSKIEPQSSGLEVRDGGIAIRVIPSNFMKACTQT
jgi:hypothetical protein